jgi:hypothetical protein
MTKTPVVKVPTKLQKIEILQAIGQFIERGTTLTPPEIDPFRTCQVWLHTEIENTQKEIDADVEMAASLAKKTK